MATRMNVSCNYGTHLPALIQAMRNTSGDVLELGMGVFSTPFLHYQCMLMNRHLTSYENFPDWAGFFKKYGYENANHAINVVDDYKNAAIDKFWDVVLIDQTPDSSRIEQVARLANLAKYLIIHDSNGRKEHVYHYSKIYPLFKYKTIWDRDSNHATVLSNTINLDGFWK